MSSLCICRRVVVTHQGTALCCYTTAPPTLLTHNPCAY